MNRRPNVLVIDDKLYFQKHTSTQRLQTIIQLLAVIVLAVTGIPLRYPDMEIGQRIYAFLGGSDIVPSIHRTAGVVLLCLYVFHTLYWICLFYNHHLKPLRRKRQLSLGNLIRSFFSQVMVINKRDLRDFFDHLRYITFISNKPPMYDRIMWKEKFEYYAQYWGITVIGLAGLALWWRDEISHVLPGIVLNAAYIAHSYEALLAVLFLSFIHWYHEFYSPEKLPYPTGFWSGYLSEKQMISEHYGRYVKLMITAGLQDRIKPFKH